MRLPRLRRALSETDRARRPPVPGPPSLGPFDRRFWRSPLRGRWLTSVLGSALLPLLVICALTGFLSHAAYQPDLGDNDITGGFERGLYFFDWPTSPAWLYAVTQSLHVLAGLAAVPVLLAKLWSVIPKLFERPPARSIAHGIERISLALLIGSALFLFATGILNIQYWLPFGFSFVPAHYYAAFIFVGAVALHVALRLPIVAATFSREGVRPLGEGIARIRAADAEHDPLAAPDPAEPTISRRGMLAVVGAGSLGLVGLTIGQSLLPALRETALLAPRGQSYGSGPNAFQVNKTAVAAGVGRADVGSGWRLRLLGGARPRMLSRAQLLALEQATERLPIACVEGWTTWQSWSGVRLAELARLAGFDGEVEVLVESIQQGGAFRQATLNRGQVADERSLLALRVNGADLSLDHGYPARVIVPALPGVHNTKWVRRMTFASA